MKSRKHDYMEDWPKVYRIIEALLDILTRECALHGWIIISESMSSRQKWEMSVCQ